MTYSYVKLCRDEAFHSAGRQYLSEDDYAGLQQALIANPAAGVIIPGSGGIRKIRWRIAGRGKRGAIRVIYFVRAGHGQIWMLTLYAKSATESIPTEILKQIRHESEG